MELAVEEVVAVAVVVIVVVRRELAFLEALTGF